MRRIGALLCVAAIWLTMSAVGVSAATSMWLLKPEETTLTSPQGAFSYTEAGALQLSAPDGDGAAVAIEFNQTLNVNAMRYIHLSVVSSAPFNVALKVGSDSYDVYPQITGPTWYEQFQSTPPGMNEGVHAGGYTVVLDLKNYIEYNQLGVGADGYVFVRSIHIFLKGMGEMTVHHLAASDMVAFAAGGLGATAAPTKVPHTTAPHGQTLPTEATYATYTSTTIAPAMNASPNENAGAVAIVMAVAIILVGALVGVSVLKKRSDYKIAKRRWDREHPDE